MIPNPQRSHLVPYNTTELERDVSLCLGIPMYGADPRLAPLGSKTGCRRLFAEVGVPTSARGGGPAHRSTTWPTLSSACVPSDPPMSSVIVKLNEGVSGAGNALVRLDRPSRAGLRG